MEAVYQPKPRTFWQKVVSCLTLQNMRFLYMLPGFTGRLRRCPVCGSRPDKVEFETRYTPLDHCGECGHVWSRKTPKKRILKLMYRDFSYWVRDKEHQNIHKVEPGPHWDVFLGARMGIARKTGVVNGSPKRFFEIGCSEGILLYELQRHGHEALGCEMNVPTAEAGMKALGVTIRTAPFEALDLPKGYYDAVLSFHTVEHLPDVAGVFRKICRILKPDGSVLIEVPTGPEEYTNPDHVQFFTEESLKRFLENYFEDTEIIPNCYTNPHGTVIGSLYGVGRRPKLRARSPTTRDTRTFHTAPGT
jgi:2-polyprenyl-3-methyl-5-hydroxy-6-metoxy-1,4-benzoquinol methylase